MAGIVFLELGWAIAGGEDRQQAALFPVMLDELVAGDALVRVVDAWVESLDMKDLGFARAQAQRLGAPPYDPADLLRLYLWGYLNTVRSSRALERECRRDVGKRHPKTVLRTGKNGQRRRVEECRGRGTFTSSVNSSSS